MYITCCIMVSIRWTDVEVHMLYRTTPKDIWKGTQRCRQKEAIGFSVTERGLVGTLTCNETIGGERWID